MAMAIAFIHVYWRWACKDNVVSKLAPQATPHESLQYSKQENTNELHSSTPLPVHCPACPGSAHPPRNLGGGSGRACSDTGHLSLVASRIQVILLLSYPSEPRKPDCPRLASLLPTLWRNRPMVLTKQAPANPRYLLYQAVREGKTGVTARPQLPSKGRTVSCRQYHWSGELLSYRHLAEGRSSGVSGSGIGAAVVGEASRRFGPRSVARNGRR